MGRPAKHSTDDFIDAAIARFAAEGIRAVTLHGVAASVGAANGSIYHRFADRPALLAAIWERTRYRFESSYREVLRQPTIDSAIAGAAWVVQWCNEHPDEAKVLGSGPGIFGYPANDELSERNRREVGQWVLSLAPTTAAPPDQIAFVMFEMPIAVVRRAQHEQRPLTTRDRELVRGLASAVLRQPAPAAGAATTGTRSDG